MKKTFSWFLSPDDTELNSIWNNGILTLDANVLLDLYRVNANTRKTLMKAIESFGDRIWLSHQAALDFINNVDIVKFNSKGIFDSIYITLDKMNKDIDESLTKIIGEKVLDKTKINRFRSRINRVLEDIKKFIDKNKSTHIDGLKTDTILDWVLDRFNNKVGSQFKNIDDIRKEAEERLENKTPPGYKDNEKDGDKKYSDFYLWKQVLTYAKNKELPMILVTSEKKEDWWEKCSGQIIRPRMEMLKEAFEISHQKILIYRTEYFIEKFAEKDGQGSNDIITEAIDEFRFLNIIDKPHSEKNKLVILHTQEVESCSTTHNKGRLFVELKHPTFHFTCSGYLNPEMENVPIIQAQLASAKKDLALNTSIKARTGTKFDFNIHIFATGKEQLQPGYYVFEYYAKCDPYFNDVAISVPEAESDS